jgi:hypothetical protein
LSRGQTLASQTTFGQPAARQYRRRSSAQSGQIRHYAVDLVVRQGTVEVSGTVADQPQARKSRIIQGVPGVSGSSIG